MIYMYKNLMKYRFSGIQYTDKLYTKKKLYWAFLGGPVAKTPPSIAGGGFSPWLGKEGTKYHTEQSDKKKKDIIYKMLIVL